MAFNLHSHKPSSRTQRLVNMAKRIKNSNQDEDLNVSSDIISKNIEIPRFEELRDVTNVDDYLDPFLGQTQIDSSIPEISNSIEILNNDICFNIKKKYILDEVTGHLREDIEYIDENFSNDDFHLDEKTGLLKPNDNMVSTNKNDRSKFSETEFSSSDEEINKKQREYNRLQRVRGKKYIGRKRKWDETENKAKYESVPKTKKYVKEKPCTHSSLPKSERSYLCGVISEEERKAVFNYFWSLNTWNAKKAYLKNLVRLHPILRRRKTICNQEGMSQKQLAFDYFIPNHQNVTVKVCKSFFVSTLNINSDTLSEWIKKLQDNTESGKDLRSKHEKRQSKNINKSDSKKIKSSTVKEWLELLNKVPSHYCRSSSSRVYLENTFESKSHIFRVYTEWCEENRKPNIGRKIFNKILEGEKISIFKPRKDQCDVCTSKKEANISEEEYTLHIQKKNEAYKAHIDASTMRSSEVLVLTVDVQSVLVCPKILVSVQYYKQKLQVHNQSIYINNNKDVHLYVWHEGDGGVTANEFTSCLIHFIKSQLNYKKVIIISDGCCYQNKNKVLSSALLKLTLETGLEIEQIILEKGHTMMQVDSVHSTLEKKFRPPIYTPSDYISRMREARPKQPYHVHHVEYTFFNNYENDVCLDSIRPGKKAGDPTVNDIRALLYKNGNIFYKLRHPEEWQILPQRVRAFNPRTVPQLFNDPRKIDKTKYDSLQSLKPYMHRDYHAFYDNLHYKE